MDTIFIPHSDYLAHHGIKGQKWGVRRYQNPDGSYTDAGRKRYSKQLEKKVNKSANNYLHNSFQVGTQMADTINKPNTSKVRKKIFDDPDYVKANERLMNAYSEHEHAIEDAVFKYGYTLKGMPESTRKSLEASGDKINDLSKKHWDQFEKTLNKYEPELLSAALADIGEEDTEVGRQLIKEIYTKKRGDQWWLT